MTKTRLTRLVKKDSLNKGNLENFDLDLSIVKHLKGDIIYSTVELTKKLGISSSTLAGRKLSLSNRGHIRPNVKYVPKNPHKPKKDGYTNADGENKEIARNKMAKYIVDSGVIGLIPTLPHIKCIIEQKILVDAPTNTFLGVELKKPIYNSMKRVIRKHKLPFKTYRGKIGDKIWGQAKDVYAHMILDYCGCLSSFSKEIEYSINNKIVKSGGIIAITFGKPHRGDSDTTKFIMSLGTTITNNPFDNRCASDKATEAYFNRIIGDNFEFVEIFNYKDDKENGKGYPMTLVILRRK